MDFVMTNAVTPHPSSPSGRGASLFTLCLYKNCQSANRKREAGKKRLSHRERMGEGLRYRFNERPVDKIESAFCQDWGKKELIR
jgi:hypothetical protein